MWYRVTELGFVMVTVGILKKIQIMGTLNLKRLKLQRSGKHPLGSIAQSFLERIWSNRTSFLSQSIDKNVTMPTMFAAQRVLVVIVLTVVIMNIACLNICWGNSDRVARGMQGCFCEKGSVEGKIIQHPQGRVDAFKFIKE